MGNSARATGKQALTAVEKAKEFDKTYDITGRAAAAARAAAAKAVEIEKKYDLTAKAKAMGENALKSARDLEEKHNVTAKVGNALGKGLDKLSSFLDAKPATAPTPAMPSALPSVPR